MTVRLSASRHLLCSALAAGLLLCPAPASAQDTGAAFFDTPQGRLWHQGVASTGMSPDSLFDELQRTSYDSVRTLAARGVSALPVEEQREVLAIRLAFSRALPTEVCARNLWDGVAAPSIESDRPTMAYMPPSDQDRLVYLSARAIALLLQGRVASPAPMTADEFWGFVEEKANTKEFSQLAAAIEREATADEKCRGVQALYQFLLRLPARSPSSARVITHVLTTMSM